jgi:hypothetical protein
MANRVSSQRLPAGAVVCLLVVLAMPGGAQVDRATLTGTVTDASEAALANAKVTAVHQGSGLSRETTVGSSGHYVLAQLPIGLYTVTVEAAGFKPVRFEKVELQVGRVRTLDVQMEIAPSATQIEVRDTAVALDRVSAEIGSVIQASQVGQLPINGRHWAGLMLLAPGAVNTGDGSQGSTRFSGRANDDNNWTFDGVDNTAVKDPTYGSNLRLVVSMDAIAEFKVSTALYTADSGNGMGGQVHLVSKSGSNEFHGSLFEYLRNSAFDARTVFDGPKLPPFRLNQFGGSLGGPVRQNKAFFFANFEGLRQRQGSTYTYQVPSDALRARVLATSPALAPVIEAYPRADRPTRDADVGEIVRAFSRKSDEDSVQARLDYNISDRTSMFARYSMDNGRISDPGGFRDDYRDTDAQRPSNAVLQFQRTFSPEVLNETRLGFNRAPLGERNYGAFKGTFNVPGLSSLPDTTYNNEKGTTYSIIDNLAVFRGRHNLKFGGEVRRIHCNVGFGGAANLTFAKMADFVSNRVDSVALSYDFGALGARRTYYFGYAQDEMKLTPNLTLNLGARYEYYSVIHEVKGRQVVFDINTGDFAPPGTPVYAPDRNNLAPRVSLAWSPRALRNLTVIRAGYGMYYGPGQVDDVMGAMESVQERYALTIAEVPALSFPVDRFLSQAKSQGLTPRHIRADRRDMYAQHWGLSIQQQLPADFVMQVGYAGSNAHKILNRLYINPLDPVTRKRQWPKFGRIDSKESAGNGNFNALQFEVKRPLRKGLLWQSEYMWSHALNDNAIGGGESTAVMISTNREADKADSNYDIRHNWSTNLVWQLPVGPGQRFLAVGGFGGKLLEGWELSGIHAARTGRAVNISVSRSSNDMPDGNTSNQRPDRVPGVPIYPANQTIDNWLNIDAFAVPKPGAWGNLGRNVARGPGVNTFDLALQKSTSLRERHRLAFRAEFFNVFNRPHFSTPASNISSRSSFGRITSPFNRTVGTGTARQIQFMLRYIF